MKPGDLARLGTLSARYESNGDPGCVSTGHGDAGGISYGMYQLATKVGTPTRFVAWLEGDHPDLHAQLVGLQPGTPEFSEAWRDLAESEHDAFAQAQHDFVRTQYYDRAREALDALPGLDVGSRSKVLNDVVWSTAVQHGVAGAARIFEEALGDDDAAQVSDEDLVHRVYAERGLKNEAGVLVHFATSSPETQRGVANRFVRECGDALKALAAEEAEAKGDAGEDEAASDGAKPGTGP